jgi:integrase
VKWDELDMGMEILGGRRTLSLDDREALFRRGLKEELARATEHITAPDGADRPSPIQHKVLAAAYRAIARIPADASSIDAAVLDAVVTPDWSDAERRLLRRALELIVTPACVSSTTAIEALAEIDAPTNEGTIKDARAQILRGYVEAQDRAELINHQLIRARGGSPQWLLDDIFVAELRQNAVRCGDVPAARIAAAAPASPTVPQAPAEPVVHSIYLTPSTMRFSEIIGPTLQSLKDKNKWKDDLRQRTAIAERFAWVTGDKPLCDYTEADIEAYVNAMRLMPSDMRYGRLWQSGHMAVPYDPAKLPRATAENQRDERSINRDLSTLHSMSTQLAKKEWRSRFGKNVIEMDFKERMIAIEDDPGDPKRMPWTPEHLRVMFSLPLWNGSGGALARLKTGTHLQVYQDAAYWAPLLAIYTGMSREEICGLEVVDFVFDCEVPFLLVQANMTRSQDGVTPGGLKRKSRHRVMPIHPELLRLGIEEYVERIATVAGFSVPEQIIPIFPELYREDAKRESALPKGELVAPEVGGKRFYKRAWMGIVDAVHALMPLPETRGGKKADFHSTRTYTQSMLASPEVSQTLIDRIMGHAAKGTGPRKYNRRALAVGEVKALKELLNLLIKEMPVVTENVQRTQSVNLLHLKKRSRVGSAPGRDVSRYFLFSAAEIKAKKEQDALRKEAIKLPR